MRYLLITNLTLVLASGALPAQGVHPILPTSELAVREQTKPLLTDKATRYLLSQKERLGLGQGDGFKIRSSALNTQGQIVLRADQTHRGYRVWGATTTARVNPGGAVETTAEATEKNVALPLDPRLSSEEALRIAHTDIAPKGAYVIAPSVERIVFPSRFTGGTKFYFDPKTKRQEIDRLNSTLAPKPSAEHVWAYEVISVLKNREDGILEMHHIVDAETGAVLRKWDGVKSLDARRSRQIARAAYSSAPLAPPRVVPLALSARVLGAEAGASSPAVGTGLSQYSGTVQMNTSLNDSGTYDLIDQTRGSLVNPSWFSGAYTHFTGNSTFFEDETNYSAWTPYRDLNGDSDNTWGDGQNYLDPINPGHPTDANGQTAAVDAHFGVATTWDFFKNIMNRNGVDNLGTSLGSIVHMATFDENIIMQRYENAFWITSLQLMFYGDGTYSPSNPGGMTSLTEPDITGHEVTHGVAAYTANFDESGEAAGLNEGNSDIFGSMVEAYATRVPGANATIPETGVDWEIGAKCGGGSPLRFMKKPSWDEISPDGWYWGIGLLDSHFSGGPLGRSFYFLSQGASNDPASETHSLFLPSGMTGIGNDRAARIWYKALSEHLTHDSGYYDKLDAEGKVLAIGARNAALMAATDLYGAGSAEVIAVENAFAAVNVGSAHGQGPRTMVVPYRVNTVGPVAAFNPYIQYVAAGEKAHVRVDVQNNPNKAVRWELGGALGSSNANIMGVLQADGTWIAPYRNGKADIRAYSVADPLQWGELEFYIANLDSDDDVEVDAIDMGAIAMSWAFPESLTPAVSVWGGYAVDDLDIYIFGEAFKSAFGN